MDINIRRSWGLFSVVALALVIIILIFWPRVMNPERVVLSSGSEGGAYYDLGRSLCVVLTHNFQQHYLEKPFTFDDKPSNGSIENLEHILVGEAQLGLAIEGLSFEQHSRNSDVRGLVKFSKSTLHIVLSRQIAQQYPKVRRLTDVIHLARNSTPLRVYEGSEKSGTKFIVEQVLKHYGASSDSCSRWKCVEARTMDDAAEKLQDGHIDLAFFLVQVGAPALQKLADAGGRLLSLDDIVEGITTRRPFLTGMPLEKGTYNEKFPDQPVKTVSADDILIASAHLSDRLVYRIVRTISLQWHEFHTDLQFSDDFSKTQLAVNDYYALHPGALAFYQGRNIPLGSGFDVAWSYAVAHRDVLTSGLGLIGSAWALMSKWNRRKRIRGLILHLQRIHKKQPSSVVDIDGIKQEAIKLLASGRINQDDYAIVIEQANLLIRSQSPSDKNH